MDLGPNARIRLESRDEHVHPIEAASNFNESMYLNCFDHAQRMGGWFRVGNRPNEGHAEMSCCVYLPDGSVGFLFQRPELRTNEAFDAAGMRIEVEVPFERLRVTYRGKLCLLARPEDMADPKQAFANNPMVDAAIDLVFHGISPMYGGEKVDEHGRPVEEAPDEAFARAHYEQHMAAVGTIRVGDRTFAIDGLGLRDHSWGPRYWQNLYWYRWMPLVFDRDFAMNVSIVTMASGKRHVWGMVLGRDAKGEKAYDLIVDAEMTSTLDEEHQARAQRMVVRTESGKTYDVEGKALSLLPLRNRRQWPDGSLRTTRITEAMTEYRCDGRVGYGMAEYLDQIEDGVPVGRSC